MNKKTLRGLLLGVVVVAALVLASCTSATPSESTEATTVSGTTTQPATTTTTTTTTTTPSTPADTGPVMMTNTAGKQQEVPQYGGTITTAGSTTFVGFDPAYTTTYKNWHLIHTHDKLLMGDWAMSSAGTGETGFLLYTFLLGSATGYLAESYELPDSTTIIFNLRQGVYWQDKPPASGREFVADDVVFSFTRLFEVPESYLVSTHKEGKRPISITALDKYTVEIKVPEGTQGPIFRDLSSQTWPIDPDIVRQDGDHKDWERIGGTGPFQMIDHIPNSSTTYVRNPNYWMKDPLTGMQLPYIDGFKTLVIPDRSTLLSALRTGKIDQMGGIQWEEKDQLLISNPEQNFKMTGLSEAGIALNTENPLWQDINVRRALFLATDNDAILNDYYGGNASMLNYPVKDLADFQAAYTPLSDLSPAIQELFTHDVAKAKQLLADAGYPSGFQTTMDVPAYDELFSDMAVILQAQWAEAGIDVTLNMLEYAAFNSVAVRFGHESLILANSLYTSSPYKAQTWGGMSQARNLARIEDDYLLSQYDKIVANFLNSEVRAATLKETVPYILENAWYLQYPNAQSYTFWQPWVKNYDGEYCMGYTNFWTSLYRFGWVDQETKVEWTGGQ
ncbi:MAG: ABC transporter substrate-binding protein [Dehalococcoidales bacterium]